MYFVVFYHKKSYLTVHLLLLSKKTSANYIILKVNPCEINTLALYTIKGGEFMQQLVVKFSWRKYHGPSDTTTKFNASTYHLQEL